MATFKELENFRRAERWLLGRIRRTVDRLDEFVHGWEVAIRCN